MTIQERKNRLKLYERTTEHITHVRHYYDREINTCMGLLNTRGWDIEYIFDCQQEIFILEVELIKRNHCE